MPAFEQNEGAPVQVPVGPRVVGRARPRLATALTNARTAALTVPFTALLTANNCGPDEKLGRTCQHAAKSTVSNNRPHTAHGPASIWPRLGRPPLGPHPAAIEHPPFAEKCKRHAAESIIVHLHMHM